MNLEDFMWKRAWSYIHEQYVKIIKIRQCQAGFPIIDALIAPFPESKVHIFRETELGDIEWIPYGSNER